LHLYNLYHLHLPHLLFGTALLIFTGLPSIPLPSSSARALLASPSLSKFTKQKLGFLLVNGLMAMLISTLTSPADEKKLVIVCESTLYRRFPA